MNSRIVKVGVIGSGGMGARHARNLAVHTAGAEVVAIMDIDQARAQSVADECSSAQRSAAKVYSDGNELINNNDVDAIVIASPNSTHAELTLACLAAGKPVLCEKPLATNLTEAEQILQAETKLGKRLVQLGLMREFDPPHHAAKTALDNGDIGPAVLFRSIHINPLLRNIRSLTNVIVGSAVHDIHSTRWIMASEVARVFAQYVPAISDQVDEGCRLVLIQLQLRNGALAIIEVNADSGYGYEVDVEITGTTGSVKTDSIQSPIVRRSNTRSQRIDADWLTRFETAYIIQAQAWIDSIIAGQAIGPSVWDGYIAQLIADACIESARSGQPVDMADMERPGIY